jgi:protein SCO1/2
MKKWTWLYGLGGLLIVGVIWFTTAQPIVVLPRIRLAPGYSLTAPGGNTVTSESARGSLTLYTFAYTQCGAGCERTYQILAELDQILPAPAAGEIPVKVITISLDPARDTPAALSAFTPPAALTALPWTWLTGSPARIQALVGDGFGVFFRTDPDGSLVYNPRMFLVDGWGIIRGQYDVATLRASVLQRDIGLVRGEIQKSTGAARMAYEAAHFFACYPH